MFNITKQYRTETAHRLMDYNGKCSHNHGHSYLWEVTATHLGGILTNGMVVDFKDLKGVMESILEPLDHATVLREDDPLLDALIGVTATNGADQRIISIPVNPTAEMMAAVFGTMIDFELSKLDLGVVLVRLWETSTSFADWSPHLQGEPLVVYPIYYGEKK